MDAKLEERMKGEVYLVNLKKHFNAVFDKMQPLQTTICENAKLNALTLVNLRKQYMDLQDTAHFLNSMYEAIDRALHPEKYENRIITADPPKNGMKIIN